jgi:hypothetical protein
MEYLKVLLLHKAMHIIAAPQLKVGLYYSMNRDSLCHVNTHESGDLVCFMLSSDV